MRLAFCIVFIAIIITLAVCSGVARRSTKPMGRTVGMITAALIPPVFGNLLIVSTSMELVATIGCYIYFIGMDMVMYALLRFTVKYCDFQKKFPLLRGIIDTLLIMDVIQFLCNPFFGNAFTTERLDDVYGKAYYRLVPFLGQTYHRVVCYGVLLAIMIVFLVKIIRSPKIYAERYSIIFFTLIVAAVWQTLYIFSRTPIDRSMIGFGISGVLMFYFSLYYRPLKLLDRMLANIASEMPEALFFFDANEKCIWANDPAISFAGIEQGEFGTATEKLLEVFGNIGLEGPEWSSRQVIGSGDETRYYALEKRTVVDDRGRAAGSFLSIRDNTEEQKRIQREIYNATHDSLTGLYTREYLYERIRHKLEDKRDMEFYVVFVDVKNFKIVNDIFSSSFGDFALQRIADWIRSGDTENWVYGRLAGDTFGVCLPVEAFHEQELEEILSRFVVRRNNVEYHILIHLGVYKITDPNIEVSVMFDRAHLALSTIRDEYQKHIAYYDDDLRKKVLWSQHISSELHDAIREMHLRPYLQPIVDKEGKIVGAEALARWIHPKDGFLSPGAFIPVFEKNGMIVEVDKHMWRCACEILSRWSEKGKRLFISVNISPKDFYFMDVFDEIRMLTEDYGIDPSLLRIEITETVMMTEAEERMRILQQFRDAGYIVEMDDFGSGYSSLNMLKDMPVDVLKLDMKFLARGGDDERAQTIIQNIIHLSDDLGIVSLTEGVETEDQFRMLARMHCILFQGYHFAKPMSVEEFEDTFLQ
ncbi:MAG: EAL domain-containing protein [Oscillospiraceae bacterium]|nr:EAL domain-containing protein [Oscillospiraceae bacterium]